MDIKTLHQYFLQSSGICTDTRAITKDCLFVALKGDNFNGNQFTKEALDKGAYKVIIDEEDYHNLSRDTLLVPNCLKALQELATFHRKHLNLPIIALTGSNGKTTSKELIHAVLSQKFKVTATKGNLNNHIGVPLTLLSMNAETEIGIVEMGANHLHEIHDLCEIAQPDFGYITNFGKAHLEGFGSVEGVIQGKTELYRHIKKHQKMVFLNATDPKQMEHSKNIKSYRFGNSQEVDCKVGLKDASESVTVTYKDNNIQSHLIGLYNFNNITAAICIGQYFNVPTASIKKGIENYIPTNNRSQLIEKRGHCIILDAYNANPSSMKVALENFKQAKGSSKIVFLGDMFELGKEAEIEHQNIVDYLEGESFCKSYLIGEHFFNTIVNSEKITTYSSFTNFREREELSKIPNSFILIKGSRGMALERVLEMF